MKYALVYGLISGTVIILTMIAGFELTEPDSVTHSLWFGYLLMLVVLTLIFVGVKRYRDIECGGVIRFGRAFLTGLGMAVVASLAYVLIFEVYLAATEYRFFEDYIAGTMQNRAAAGASAAEVASERASLESILRNPLVRVPMVFLEIFPVGLVVAFVSALLLRNPRLLPATRAA
jgi:hypothetical protein